MMQNFFKAGNQYFFNQNGKVKMGTLQYCEECGKPCNVNAVTITQAPSKLIAKKYNSDMNESEEMYYNEEKNLSLCDECY